ncbi:hypothetical protein [Candidatus Reidiella endopervernicosa]|nr:hypothetical protein [Candidatus Reidiella endopervernicosa]
MIWGVNFFFSYKLYENLENNVISGKKMQLMSNMIVTVRQRSKITNQMLITEDIFERDELLMKLDSQASTYTVQRETFLALPLTEDERNRSAQQDVLVCDIVPRLRHAAELAMTGEDEDFNESKRILYDDVMPRQEQLIINR